MKILGIETSCDETAVAVVECEGGLSHPKFRVLGSALHSQVDTHKLYGGVYPNMAKREHIKNLPHVLKEALERAKCSMADIDKIAVTVGPGLEPALWTGIKFAEDLSKRWEVPLIPTNHMEGHIASVLLDRSESKGEIQKTQKEIQFPAIALLISGGHTELVLLRSWTDKEVIGKTLDDAVGEAFDKVARMLGLPYPGGPEISALAEKARNSKYQTRNIKLPRPMLRSGDLNFSFSGLKTAVLYKVRNLKKEAPELTPELIQELAQEFENSVTEVLVEKVKTAIALHNPHTLIVGGGVIANSFIRDNIMKLKDNYPNLDILIPEHSLTTDNAVMIAMAGYLQDSANTEGAQPFHSSGLRAQGNLSYS